MHNYHSSAHYTNAAVMIVTIAIALGAAGTNGKEISGEVQQAWEDEFEQLGRRISTGSGPAKRVVAESDIADRSSLVLETDRDPLDVALRRVAALINNIKSMPEAPDLSSLEEQLDQIRRKSTSNGLAKARADQGTYDLFMQAKSIGRQVALLNPLLDFDEMIFVAMSGNIEGVLQCWNHAYGVDAGGGLYRVSGIRSGQPQIHDILAGATVQSGRYQGQTLSGSGAFNLAGLDYDGETVAFSWTPSTGPRDGWPRDTLVGFTPSNTFHLFKINKNGAGLTQLSDGRRNDYHPCFLPSGRIAFISDRRNVMDRCQTCCRSQMAGTLYSIKADGSDMICLSKHEVTELMPSVDNDGMIVYTRWDYIDRDFSAAHHLWICYPDGRDPRAPHGNYPFPHHTFEGSWVDGRADRPWAEYSIRAIPGSHKYVATASLHHIDYPRGEPVIIDISVEDDNRMSQVTRLRACALLDEGWDYHGAIDEGLPVCGDDFLDPWALSEDFIIAASGNSVWLLDKYGNKDLLFSATTSSCNGIDMIRCPIPLKARTKPPVAIPTGTWQGERSGREDHYRATIGVMNVYISDQEWPANTVIKWIRVIQIFPYPWHSPFQDIPRIGPADGSLARMVLGTVPVEDDGSAYFEAPIDKEIYFQALNENGMAVQSMRSGTYVHAGEQLTCVGCHESKWEAPQPSIPTAFQRDPSPLVPNLEDGSAPLTYSRLVEPVLEQSCRPCHTELGIGEPQLADYRFAFIGTGGSSGLFSTAYNPVQGGGYRTKPGWFGALYTGLAGILMDESHRPHLTMEDINRITLWVDANSNELGAYHNVDEQRAGQVVWPTIDVDPAHPSGVELDRPLPPRGGTIAKDGFRMKSTASGELFNLRTAGDALIVTDLQNDATIVLSNLAGRELLRMGTNERKTVRIPAQYMPSGMYWLTVYAARSQSTRMVPLLR